MSSTALGLLRLIPSRRCRLEIWAPVRVAALMGAGEAVISIEYGTEPSTFPTFVVGQAFSGIGHWQN